MGKNKVVINTEINTANAEKGASVFVDIVRKMALKVANIAKKIRDSFDDAMNASYEKSQYGSYGFLASMEMALQRMNARLKAFVVAMLNPINAIKLLGTTIKNVALAPVKMLKSALTGFNSEAKKTTESTKKMNSGFKVGLKTILKYGFGIRSLYFLFRKIRQALIDGFKNLAQFNDGVNPVNTALSNLKSALLQLKNSFATAFAPVLTVIEPALTALINRLSQAMTVIGQFFASLSGAKTFTKAIKTQENYAKSLDGTSKSAKKAKDTLAKFDELNVVKQGDNSGSGGTTPNQMFEEVQIPSGIANLAEKVREILKPLKDSLVNWFDGINWQPLIDSFGKLKQALEPITSTISQGLLFFLENVLEPIGSFVIEDALPKFFELLSKVAGYVTKAFEELKPVMDDIWNNVFVPLGTFLKESFYEAFELISDGIDYVAKVFDDRSDDIKKILDAVGKAIEVVGLVVKATIQFMIGAIKPFFEMVSNIIGHVIDILVSLIDFIKNVFAGDWKKAWESICDVFKGIWNVIVDIFEGVINMIIGGLNKISVDIPDWIPAIGGKKFGFNLQEIHLPRLATGTVVPRQSSEFMAILGDNNREAEVVSPLSTMKQAFMEALAESNGLGNGTVNLVLNLDGKTVYNRMVQLDREHANRTGMSGFAY